MAGTSSGHRDKVREYYVETTEKSYMRTWAEGSLGFHIGIADDTTTSHAESILAVNALLADRNGIGRGTRVLDGGCGVGGTTLWLAAERGADATGITIVPEQVDIARKLAAERGLAEAVTFECMDMVATTFPEASFDVVINCEAMCHVESLPAYFDHLSYLLRDGGRFAVVDLCRGEPIDLTRERLACEGWAMVQPMRTIAEIAADLAAAGFVDVQPDDLTPRARLSAQALLAMATNTRPLLRLEAAMFGERSTVYEAHVEGAVAFTEGLLCGSMRLGYVSGVRPPRR
jgi:cyclopropane fatty-acyl-phospholipid synthase-like methyltransferase